MFDRQYRIRDLYFPHVGKENHGAGHPFRFGVWVGGQFSWMGPEWIIDMRYADSSMVTEVRARNQKLGVELICNDGVDFYENVLIRRVQIVNLVDRGWVASTLGVSLMVPPGATGEFYYWMAAARDFREVSIIDQVVRDKSPEELLRRTGNYWRLWVSKDRRGSADLPLTVVERY